MRALALLLIVGGSMGCRNSCQRLCVRLHAYAEECGLDVDEDELVSCIEDEDSVDKDSRQLCGEHGSAEALRAAWSCEDLAVYWDAEATTNPDPTEDTSPTTTNASR